MPAPADRDLAFFRKVRHWVRRERLLYFSNQGSTALPGSSFLPEPNPFAAETSAPLRCEQTTSAYKVGKGYIQSPFPIYCPDMGENSIAPPKRSANANMEALEKGRPVFSRALFEYVDRVWSTGEGKLIINDVYGKPHELEVNPKWNHGHHCERDEGCTPYAAKLSYNSYQRIADTPRWSVDDRDRDAYDDELKVFPRIPISVNFSSFFQGTGTYDDVLASYRKTSTAWFTSKACTSLKHSLATALVGTIPIDRIVCFALGGLQRSNRSEAQHACIQTLRESLPKDATTGAPVPVFVQDPSYAAVDKQILAAEAFTVVDDPKAFLAITPNTLVMSLSPDIPVRQIIADVQWPAALICDTIRADDTNFEKREFIEFEGTKVRVSPYTTDPCSKRVQAMVEGCKSFKFPKSEYFGRVTVYLRGLEPAGQRSEQA